MSDLSRREALKLVAASAVGAPAACTAPAGPAASPAPESVALPPPAADPVLRVRPLGYVWPTQDPFLFCVHHADAYPAGDGTFGPRASLAGRDLGQDFAVRDGWRMYHGMRVPGFPQHPHRGFETVTVVRQGLVDHADSLGAAARYGNGDVQWLTAGAGIQHAEMFPLLREDVDNPLELFQIWLNLPAANKMAQPHFSMLWGDAVPRIRRAGVEVTVVAGALEGLRPPSPPPNSWAARADRAVAIWALRLDAGASFDLPAAAAGVNRTLYFYKGSQLALNGRAAPAERALDLRADVATKLDAGVAGAEALVLQGRPIGEPVAQHGPFVMNTRAELQQAYADYQRTQFGGWPWPDRAPVHAREQRFARRPDGTVERPG